MTRQRCPIPARRRDPNERGVSTLVTTFLLLILLLTLGAASLIASSIDLRSTSHYDTGRQAFFAAESGVIDAVSAINARGVINFNTDIANPTAWGTLFGASTKSFPGYSDSGYAVAVAASATAPGDRGTVTAIGFAPLQAQRVIEVSLRKDAVAGPGALYLAADQVQTNFGARDQFRIDGNDHTLADNPNPNGPVVPGITTRNDTVTQDAIDTLSDPQKQRVMGYGFSLSPLQPSIKTVGGPTVTDLEDIVQYLLANNPVTTINDPGLASGTYGTLAAPQITHLTNRDVHLNGDMSGVGILIADGEFTINGNADFIGWMIIRGRTVLNSRRIDDETLVDGNATIVGSLWTGDLVVQVGGSAIIDYCVACLELADTIGIRRNVPRKMTVTSWREVL